MNGRGIKDLQKCDEEMSKNFSLPSQEQQETSELNGSGGGRGKGIRGPRPFVPVGASNREKRPLPPAGPASRWTRDKSHYCPGLKVCRDKWSGTKAITVVVITIDNY